MSFIFIAICWFDAQETFIFIINVEKSCCLIFCGKRDTFFQDSLINVFTLTFEFNASLLNKGINFKFEPQLLNGSVYEC